MKPPGIAIEFSTATTKDTYARRPHGAKTQLFAIKTEKNRELCELWTRLRRGSPRNGTGEAGFPFPSRGSPWDKARSTCFFGEFLDPPPQKKKDEKESALQNCPQPYPRKPDTGARIGQRGHQARGHHSQNRKTVNKIHLVFGPPPKTRCFAPNSAVPPKEPEALNGLLDLPILSKKARMKLFWLDLNQSHEANLNPLWVFSRSSSGEVRIRVHFFLLSI